MNCPNPRIGQLSAFYFESHLPVFSGNLSPVTKSELDLQRAFSYRVDISFIRVNHARERQFSKENSADEN